MGLHGVCMEYVWSMYGVCMVFGSGRIGAYELKNYWILFTTIVRLSETLCRN